MKLIVEEKETSCAKKEQTFNYLHPHKPLQMSRWHQSSVKICLQICVTQAISGTLHAAINPQPHSYNVNILHVTFYKHIEMDKTQSSKSFVGKYSNI